MRYRPRLDPYLFFKAARQMHAFGASVRLYAGSNTCRTSSESCLRSIVDPQLQQVIVRLQYHRFLVPSLTNDPNLWAAQLLEAAFRPLSYSPCIASLHGPCWQSFHRPRFKSSFWWNRWAQKTNDSGARKGSISITFLFSMYSISAWTMFRHLDPWCPNYGFLILWKLTSCAFKEEAVLNFFLQKLQHTLVFSI